MSDTRRGIRLRNTERGYGAVAKSFHWIIALAVIGMLAVGYTMVHVMEKYSDLQISTYQVHKAVGVTVLGLVLLRLLWRWVNRTPALPENMNIVERAGARATHWGFYVLLIAQPVSGLLMQAAFPFRDSASPWILKWFPFLRAVPTDAKLSDFLPGTSPELDISLYDAFKAIHFTLSFVILGFLILHVLAALRHHIVKKDDTLRRMLPGHRA